MAYTTIGNGNYADQLIAFNKARMAQYAERTGQTPDQAMSKMIQIYGHDQNQEAVNAEIDAVVDTELKSFNRPGLTPKQAKLF